MYNERDAAQFLADHPDFVPVFQEGRAGAGMIQLVAFASDDCCLFEMDFEYFFPIRVP